VTTGNAFAILNARLARNFAAHTAVLVCVQAVSVELRQCSLCGVEWCGCGVLPAFWSAGAPRREQWLVAH
jgi:hypothetical protein